MKYMISFIFINLLFCVVNLAQVQIDSSNYVKQVLLQQIELAKAKQKMQSENLKQKSQVQVNENQIIEKNTVEEKASINPVVMKILILLSASGLIFTYVFLRRKKMNKVNSEKILKENIKKIRNEQLVVSIDPRLKAIRKKLVLNSSYLKKSDEQVKFAKKNQIGESELLLAMKLNDYQRELSVR